MPDIVTIRVATHEDLPALHPVIERAYRGETARQGWTHEADLIEGQRTDIATLAAIINDPAQRLLVALGDSVPIGCVQVSDRGEFLFAAFELRLVTSRPFDEELDRFSGSTGRLRSLNDGISFLTYAENFSMRYEDEFGYNAPIIADLDRQQLRLDRIRRDPRGRYDVADDYSVDLAGGEIFVQNAEEHTHSLLAPDLGMGPYRNSVIIAAMLGREAYPVEKRIAVQTFGVPDRFRSPAIEEVAR